MASAQKRAIFSLIAVIAVLLPSIASANVYFVGDEFGWDLGVSYRSWAKGKTFRVGDKLIFTYVEGNHDVVKVDASGFANCDTSGNSGILSSGNDTITLTSSGKKWYICGFEGHCGFGQKLVITVEPNDAPAPAPEVSIPWVSVPVAPPDVATPGASAVPKEYSSRKMMMGGAPAPASTWVVPGFSWVAVPVAPPVVETPGLSLQPDEYAPPAEPLSPSWPPESVPWVPSIPGVPISSPEISIPSFPSPSGAPC